MARRTQNVQHGFTAGMLDPALVGRKDLKAYYAGAQDLTNLQALPQGGVTLRAGLAYKTDLPEAASGVRLAKFEFSTEQTYLIAFTDLKIHIFRDGIKQLSLTSPYPAAQISQLNWTQSLDTMILVHPDHAPKRLMRQGAHDAWVLEDVPLTNVPQFTFNGGSAEEDVWSNNRGWPRSVYLYEGRLYFGGSKARPQTVWGSKANAYFDFGTTEETLDDEAVEMTLDGDRVSAIEQLYALGGLFAFTSGGVFVNDLSPVTPQNFFFRRHSESPAASSRPAELDGGLIFIKRDGAGDAQSVYELAYQESQKLYQAQDLALLSASLINQPKQLAVKQGDKTNSADHLYLVNADGSLAVLQSRRSQQITSWTRFETKGSILSLAVTGNQAWLVVKRQIAGQTHYCLEFFDPTIRLDSSQTHSQPTATASWTGLERWNDQLVDLVGDDEPLGQFEVKDGTLDLPYPVTKLELGYAFDWRLETMPLEASLSASNSLSGQPHRLMKVTLQLENTQGLKLNGQEIALKQFGQQLEKGARFTGLLTRNLLGWQKADTPKGATLTLNATSTRPLTLHSVTTVVGS